MLAAAAALIILAPSIVSATDCRLFTVGECTPSNDIWVDEVPMPCESSSDVDMCIKACQMFCLYDAKCNIFSYSVSKQLCTLIQETSFMNYLAGCDVLSGPGHPLIEECAMDHPDEQCERFIAQDCIYTGDIKLNKTNVENPVDCQTLLDAQGGLFGANLFVHYADQDLCQFRGSADKTCDAISGPQDPEYSVCPSTFFP